MAIICGKNVNNKFLYCYSIAPLPLVNCWDDLKLIWNITIGEGGTYFTTLKYHFSNTILTVSFHFDRIMLVTSLSAWYLSIYLILFFFLLDYMFSETLS